MSEVSQEQHSLQRHASAGVDAMKAAKIVGGLVLGLSPMVLLAYASGGWPAIAGTAVVVAGFAAMMGGAWLFSEGFGE
jgi:4-hydroxybenzoate polyprenyltransferase